MIRKIHFVFLLISIHSLSQENLSDLLKKYNTESVPYISSDSLKLILNDVLLFDAREKVEFETSHIKNALFVGYDKFNLEKTNTKIPNKNDKIIVYCSLGIRSSTIAIKLKKAGYTNVLNLYGGIFEWKNSGYRVYNRDEKETEKVHTYKQEWSKWLLKGEKKYE
jgi:rhodanese-related sulfurtransferase